MNIIPQRLYSWFSRLRQRVFLSNPGLNFLDRIHPSSQNRDWIFVVGCYNSGTTLLSRLLGAHPAIDRLPKEGVWLTDVLRTPEQLGWPRMWWACEDVIRSQAESLSNNEVDRLFRHWGFWLTGDGTYALEKSVSHAPRISTIANWLDSITFVHIIRDARAVAEGIRRRGNPHEWGNRTYREGYPLEMCAKQWERSYQVIRSELEVCDAPFYELHYEDLVSQPDEALERITDFLGIPAVPEEAVQRRWQFQEYCSQIKNMNDDAIARLQAEELSRIEDTVEETLARLGYA